MKTVTFAEGSTIQASDLPIPQPNSGYGTGKWDTDSVGKTVNGDVAYTWTYTHYKDSYVLVNDNASIGTAPADTETAWYGFKGHSGGEAYALTVTGATGSIISVSPKQTEVNLSVTPVPVQRTVTVNAGPAEGGTVTGGGTVAEGQETTVTATATEGYAFVGWYNGDTKVSDDASYSFTVTGDITLTARFVKMWTVTMDINGGTIGRAASSTMDFEDGHVDRLPTVEDMAGWIADGTWITGPADSEYIGAEITDANGTKTYQPGDVYTVVSDAAIKVLWRSTVVPPVPPTTHTVTFDANGHGTAPAAQAVEDGSTITLPAPTREGYSFDSWHAWSPPCDRDIMDAWEALWDEGC